MLTPRRLLMTVDAVGGVWRYAIDLATGLAAQGVETTLLGFGPRPSEAQRREAEAVARLDWVDLPLDWTAGSAEELAPVPDAIAARAQRAGADMVQVNQPSQAAGLALDLPVVAVSHSCVASWFRVVRGTALPEEWSWRGALNARGLNTAGTVVAPTKAYAQIMAACYPGAGRHGRIEVVPNATSVRPSPAPKRHYAYAAARWWDEGKDAATLDAAAAITTMPVFAAGATRSPDGTEVKFRHARGLGRNESGDLMELAAGAWAFVSPSRYEPFGLAALEAARAGATLILADIPTYRETWDGAAIFAPPGDADAFAKALTTLAGDRDRRDALAAEAGTRAARLTPEAQAARMLEIYRRTPVGGTSELV